MHLLTHLHEVRHSDKRDTGDGPTGWAGPVTSTRGY